jgi:hypothetical protein
MGRGSENLSLARASRPSVAGAARRVPRSADYTGDRLSFGNERAAPLVFPSSAIVAAIGAPRRRADLRTTIDRGGDARKDR